MNNQPELLPIRVYGDTILKIVAQPVGELDDNLRTYISNLIYTMYERDGVGLAAPQTGHNHRMFVIDPDWGQEGAERKPVVMINPMMTHKEGEYEIEEGCLSVPGIYAHVKRFNQITVVYTDMEGKERTETAEGYRSVVIQHEYDHLNGMLFVDRLSKLNLLKLKRKLKQIQKTAVNGVNIRTDIYDPNIKAHS